MIKVGALIIKACTLMIKASTLIIKESTLMMKSNTSFYEVFLVFRASVAIFYRKDRKAFGEKCSMPNRYLICNQTSDFRTSDLRLFSIKHNSLT